jgi:hypothetical protein
VATATAAGVLWVGTCYGRAAVVYPMHDQAGRLVAVNARHVDRGTPKTHSVGDRALGVFATPGALAAPGGAPLVVVEGPADALSLATCDIPAVALVCTRAPRWLRSAAALRDVRIGLDADHEGDEQAAALADELAPFARSVERLRPPAKDWNDALLAGYGDLVEWLEEHLGR